jgi:transcriptional regulator with XRE-family HTH domain
MPDSPTVHQRRLRIELRRAREAAGLTQEDVARNLEWSLSKVIRIEAGTVRVAITDVKVLLQLYSISPERTEELVALARAAREQAWWSGYRRTLSSSYIDLIGYESAASTVREFQPLVLPGLLQTSAYARAFIASTIREERRHLVDDLVDVRVRRQEIFERDEPPSFYFLFDEAVVRRVIGGSQVMREQVRHLLETTRQPNVTIEVVPFGAGAHQGLLGSFKMIEFPEAEDDDVLYLEGARGSLISRDLREEIVEYRERFEQLRRISLGPEGSAVFLSTLVETL